MSKDLRCNLSKSSISQWHDSNLPTRHPSGFLAKVTCDLYRYTCWSNCFLLGGKNHRNKMTRQSLCPEHSTVLCPVRLATAPKESQILSAPSVKSWEIQTTSGFPGAGPEWPSGTYDECLGALTISPDPSLEFQTFLLDLPSQLIAQLQHVQ